MSEDEKKPPGNRLEASPEAEEMDPSKEWLKTGGLMVSIRHPDTQEMDGLVWLGIARPDPEQPEMLSLRSMGMSPAAAIEAAEDILKAAMAVARRFPGGSGPDPTKLN
jgi:hypothetical protein